MFKVLFVGPPGSGKTSFIRKVVFGEEVPEKYKPSENIGLYNYTFKKNDGFNHNEAWKEPTVELIDYPLHRIPSFGKIGLIIIFKEFNRYDMFHSEWIKNLDGSVPVVCCGTKADMIAETYPDQFSGSRLISSKTGFNCKTLLKEIYYAALKNPITLGIELEFDMKITWELYKNKQNHFIDDHISKKIQELLNNHYNSMDEKTNILCETIVDIAKKLP